ncbi:MAG: hypothetical protein FJ221_10145 [Lentisphaerae bacterium]|nr:hypothetical protein [Lentisphaerota bacterium]
MKKTLAASLAALAWLEASAAPPQGSFGGVPDYTAAQIVFTGALTAQQEGPVGLSFPPMYTGRLTFEVDEVLRGDVERGKPLALGYVSRQEQPPAFPVGAACLVTATAGREGTVVRTVRPVAAADLEAAREAVQVPIGWTRQGDGWLSPWAGLGDAAWPKDAVASKGPCCARTGRPALLAGPGVKLSVEPVPPKRAIEWTNPDGDGEIRVTVSNPGKDPVPVPALLRSGGRILWEESLVLRCQGRAFVVPGAGGVKSHPEPVVLKPGESVSTVVNILRVEGPEWPGGGNRIEFQVCLGERSAVQSFYYMARHHDPLRAEAVRTR